MFKKLNPLFMEIKFDLLFMGGGGVTFTLPTFSSYLGLEQSNFEDKGIQRTRMDLPSFRNESMQLCMHAWAHACT